MSASPALRMGASDSSRSSISSSSCSRSSTTFVAVGSILSVLLSLSDRMWLQKLEAEGWLFGSYRPARLQNNNYSATAVTHAERQQSLSVAVPAKV